jgi:hypothetical protein
MPYAIVNYLCFIAAFAGVIMVFQKTDKLKKLGFLIWPVKDAFLNKFEATPTTILKNLRLRSQHSSFSIITHSFQNLLSGQGLTFWPSRRAQSGNAA